MLTPRENFLTTLYGGTPDYVPYAMLEMQMCGILPGNLLERPPQGGVDPFGCEWTFTKDGPMNKPGFALFEDIADWKDHFIRPDLSQYDFKAMAEKEAQLIPQKPIDQCVRVLFSQGDQWDRLIAYMGMENALMALVEDPDACRALLEAYTEVKIEFINKLVDIYRPDVIGISDDTASMRSMFMSPDTYRSVIKPYHKALCDVIRGHGIVPMIHTCGKCEEIIPDYVEMGVRAWHSAQTVNDLSGILDKYGHQIAVVGGWESQGAASYLDEGDTDEALRVEARRCLTEYKKPGFVLSPIVMNKDGMAIADPRMAGIKDVWEEMRWF